MSGVMTYDDFLALFDTIESGEITEKEAPNLSLVLAYLAREEFPIGTEKH